MKTKAIKNVPCNKTNAVLTDKYTRIICSVSRIYVRECGLDCTYNT